MAAGNKPELTHQRLVELLEYCPLSGCLFWRSTRALAGTLSAGGYQRIKIDGKSFMGHRVAYYWCMGHWPEFVLDHRSRNRLDNRMANLRPATQKQNMENRTAPVKGRLEAALRESGLLH